MALATDKGVFYTMEEVGELLAKNRGWEFRDKEAASSFIGTANFEVKHTVLMARIVSQFNVLNVQLRRIAADLCGIKKELQRGSYKNSSKSKPKKKRR